MATADATRRLPSELDRFHQFRHPGTTSAPSGISAHAARVAPSTCSHNARVGRNDGSSVAGSPPTSSQSIVVRTQM